MDYIDPDLPPTPMVIGQRAAQEQKPFDRTYLFVSSQSPEPVPEAAGAAKPETRQGHFTPDEARGIYIRGYGITSSEDAKPILGTIGLGPCLGAVIYNPATKTGALAHIDTNTDVSSLKQLIESAGGKDEKLEVHLAGGWAGEENSQRMVGQVLDTLKGYDNVSIKTADIMNAPGAQKSLALNTRTGEIYNRFMGIQLDRGSDRQAVMNYHMQTVNQILPLRPEYVHGQSFSPVPARAPNAAAPGI